MRYNLTVSNAIDPTTLCAAIHAIDPSATIIVDPQLTEVEKLCNEIRNNSKFEIGYINATNINKIIESGLTVGLDVTDQVRFNGADISLHDELHTMLCNEGETDYYRVTDAWSEHVHGDLLHEMGDILLLALFGTKPVQSVIDVMRDCKLKCDHMTEDDQRALFTDYAQFVNNTLNRASVEYGINIDINEGFDS